ncbi:MAG: hypothetical protein Tsb0014_08030 [Pleurocapsa sp.]
MKIKWHKLIANLLIWAISEITLNFIGLDTLADYSEFIFEKHPVIEVNYTIPTPPVFIQ